MLAIGGQAPKAIRNVECYDFKEERWFQVTFTWVALHLDTSTYYSELMNSYELI